MMRLIGMIVIILTVLTACAESIPPHGYVGEWLINNPHNPLVALISALAESRIDSQPTITCHSIGSQIKCALPTKWREDNE